MTAVLSLLAAAAIYAGIMGLLFQCDPFRSK